MSSVAMFDDGDAALQARSQAARQERRADASLDRQRAKKYSGAIPPERNADSMRLPRRTSPPNTLPAAETAIKQQRGAANLDSSAMVELHTQLIDSYRREIDRQTENRMQMAMDEDFYDHIQWDPEDEQVVLERGQVPLVFNIIASPVNWVIGTEKRGRSDYKILPRRKEDAKPAQRKTELLKYLSDVNLTPFQRSEAFEDSVKCGLGWLEDGWQGDDDGEPIYSTYESWRNILYDSSATKKDLSDCRYIFRQKWFDLDVAVAMFPNRKDLIEQCVESPTPYMSYDSLSDEPMDSVESANQEYLSTRADSNSSRRRVRLIEAWIRQPKNIEVVSGGMFAGEIFDPSSPGHVDAINNGESTLVRRLKMQMHVAIMVSGGMLWYSPSPYRHNQFPFTPIWGYRRKRDGLPYGMIRGLRDIQADVNKRASKALHILNSNKVIMDEGAVDDVEEFREEVARPDAVLIKRQGKELKIDVDRDLTQWQMQMMQSHIALAEKAAGVNNDNLGLQTNAKSGIAIQRRQEQGAMVTTIFFDNLRLASQLQGSKQLSMAEQFMSAPKQFRITNLRGKPDFIDINDGLPENDIVRSKADFVISESDWRNSMREAAVAELMELVSKFPPEIAVQMLDLLVDEMDIKNRDELVKRIRAINGQRDPDADPTEITPEEQAKAAMAQKKQAFDEAMAQAELKKLISESEKNQAATKQILTQLVGSNVDAQSKALAAARESLLLPTAVPVADFILDQSGFVSKSDQEDQARQISDVMRQAQAQAGQAQAAQQQEEQQPGQDGPGAPPLGIDPAAQPQPGAPQ